MGSYFPAVILMEAEDRAEGPRSGWYGRFFCKALHSRSCSGIHERAASIRRPDAEFAGLLRHPAQRDAGTCLPLPSGLVVPQRGLLDGPS